MGKLFSAVERSVLALSSSSLQGSFQGSVQRQRLAWIEMKATVVVLLASLLAAEAKQRFPAKLAPNQGIEPCRPSRRRTWDYGYALLKEAGIYDSAGKPVKQRELGVAGLDLKVGQKYTVKVELVAKKDNPFGSLPKFLGVKLSENYTAADSRAQGAFQAVKRSPFLGFMGAVLVRPRLTVV